MANLSFILGIAGNVISILMFASPIKTFRGIIQKKSTEDYKSLPYITTLLSTSLWSFYGLLKPGGLLVVTVNGTGAILHIIYVSLFLVYAPKEIRVKSMKLVALVDVAFFGGVVMVTLLALHGTMRLTLVGILSTALNIAMYAAPLAVMKTVIKTRSVEYMPFFLSFFQFFNGGIWAAYALLVKDIYIGVPNGVGFLLASAQLILYAVYRNKSKQTEATAKMQEEGSAHLVKGVVEMHNIQGKSEEKNPNLLNNGRSLPKSSKARDNDQNITTSKSLTQKALAIPEGKNDDLHITLRH